MKRKVFLTIFLFAIMLLIPVSAYALVEYRDPLSGVYLFFPDGWEREDDSYLAEPWQAIFCSEDESEEFFISVSDVWAEFPEDQKKGLKRSDLTNDLFSAEDLQKSFAEQGYDYCTVKSEKIRFKEYFVISFEDETLSIPVRVKIAIRVEDGYYYMFRSNLYQDTSDSNFYYIVGNATYKSNSIPLVSATPTSQGANEEETSSISSQAVKGWLVAAVIGGVSAIIGSILKKKKAVSQKTDSFEDALQYHVPAVAEVKTEDVSEQKRCRVCGKSVQKGTKFCRECGAPVVDIDYSGLKKESVSPPLICNYCGAQLTAGMKFCNQCGEPIFYNPMAGIQLERAKAPRILSDEILKEQSRLELDVPSLPPKLRRAFLFIEDEEWSRAEEYFEQVLDEEPENAYAYLGKAMIEAKVSRPFSLTEEELATVQKSRNYTRAKKFADGRLKCLLNSWEELS